MAADGWLAWLASLAGARAAAACPTDPPPDPDQVTKYSAFRYTLGGLYLALCGWVFFLLWRLWAAPGRRWQKLFYGFVSAGGLGRAIYFMLQPSIYTEALDVPNCVNSLLNMIPSLWLFSAYFVLAFFWCALAGCLLSPARSGRLTDAPRALTSSHRCPTGRRSTTTRTGRTPKRRRRRSRACGRCTW